MKTLNNYINEALIKKDTKIKIYNYYPKDIFELREIIETRLKNDKNAELNDIDVSKIISFCDTTRGQYRDKGLFEDLDPHNIDISNWNVSKVEDMRRVFFGCKNLICDISEWNVSNVEYMGYIFFDCQNFNCDLSKWDISKVKDMSRMFYDCYNFNSDLSHWDVSNVEDKFHMFHGCKALKNKPSWYKE